MVQRRQDELGNKEQDEGNRDGDAAKHSNLHHHAERRDRSQRLELHIEGTCRDGWRIGFLLNCHD